MNCIVRIGTRGSRLALFQAHQLTDALGRCGVSTKLRVFSTAGDLEPQRPILELGDVGLFTKTLEHALLSREIDIAVHSCKDLPSCLSSEFELAAVLPRGPASDALVTRRRVASESISDLPEGAQVGTGSPRRRAALLAVRPDLTIRGIRGNVDTRLRKLRDGQHQALVLAVAAVQRIGVDSAEFAVHEIPSSVCLPAAGQGAIVCEIRRDDMEVGELTGRLDHFPSRCEVEAERSVLAFLSAGCRAAVGVRAVVDNDAEISLTASVWSVDGTRVIHHSETGPVAERVAVSQSLATALIEAGALELIREGPRA